MSQMSFADAEYAGKRKKTRREVFLDEMNQVIPWAKLVKLIEPFYPVAGQGRRPYPLEAMLRVHLMQNFFTLSDPAMEEALYDSASMRHFAGFKLSGAIPDETTILNFRHLLEEYDLAEDILAQVNKLLAAKGLLLKRGTIVDATIIAAPSSTKNASGERDPEMHQTKKGNQWHFGMKAHIGVDAESGLVHTVVGTAANAADVTQTAEVLHGEETTVYLDAGYTGVEKREELKDRDIDWQVATKRSKLKAIPKESQLGPLLRRLESVKASIRSKVEHPFHIVKNLFSHRKVRYKGLKKNTAQLHILFALANLVIAKRQLLALHSQDAS